MITLDYSFFDMSTRHIMRKLTTYTGFKTKTAYWVGRLSELLRSQQIKVQEEYLAMAKSLCTKDDKGEPIFETRKTLGPNGEMEAPFFTFTEENQKLYDKEALAFRSKEFSIKAPLIPFEELDGVGLSPEELVAIEPLVGGIPDEEDESKTSSSTEISESNVVKLKSNKDGGSLQPHP